MSHFCSLLRWGMWEMRGMFSSTSDWFLGEVGEMVQSPMALLLLLRTTGPHRRIDWHPALLPDDKYLLYPVGTIFQVLD